MQQKIVKYCKTIGVVFLLVALILNPLIVEQLFSPDKNLSSTHWIDVILFDLFFLSLGVLALFIQPIIGIVSKSKTLQNAIIFIGLIIFIVLIIESFFFLLLIIKGDDMGVIIYSNSSEKFYIYDELLGYRGAPNFNINAVNKLKDGQIIYNVTYNLDQFGRRKTEEKSEQKSLILFGGSFVFGEGLDDNSTLSYFLSEYTAFSVYNYGIGGYGTQQMLVNLERKDFIKEIPNREGIAIYVFIEAHVRRVIGDSYIYNIFGYDFPYYYLDENYQLKRKGSFSTGRPITSIVYRVLGLSNFFKYFEINLPPKKKEHVFLTYKIIEKSKELYELKFDGEFYVVIHPKEDCNSDITNYLTTLLKENNIRVIQPCFENYKEYTIPIDGHPNAELNRILAKIIADDFKNIK